MQSLQNSLREFASDAVLFPVLQFVLFVIALLLMILELIAKWRAGFGGAKLIVKRSEDSMRKFYAFYVAVSGVFIAICLTVSAAENHRIFWVLVDSILIVYICLFNSLCRNFLLGQSDKLTKIEQR